MADQPTMRVECTECNFSRFVRPEDEQLPGEVVVEHGRKTGHRLSVTKADEDLDPLSQ